MIIHRTALVPYSVSQMYDLVNNIEDYSLFLPWCKSSQILSRNEDEVRACLVLAQGHLEKSFVTCNRLQKNKMIEIRLVNGPFRFLEGFWRFDGGATENTCQIALDLEFEFSSKMVSMLFGAVFNKVANTLVDAFVQRAKVVYGL